MKPKRHAAFDAGKPAALQHAAEGEGETLERLRAQNEDLQARLEEAQDTLRAIRSGDVDAFVVGEPGAQRVYTLEGAERPYRIWVEKMQQGAATLLRDGSMSYCNRRMAELLGAAPDVLLGTFLGRFIADEDRAEFDALLASASAGQCETHLQRADGSRVPVLLTLHALAPDGAAPLGLLATDLTVQKHHDHLTGALADRERLEGELRQVVANLSESDRRKSEFLAMLAHELRNPLAPISNALQVLQLRGGHAAETARLLGMMRRHVDLIVRLIDDLLDVSRISRGKIELRLQEVDLAAIVEQAVEAVRPACEGLRQRLTVSLPEGAMRLRADATRLTQVLGNLLNNACKFTATGGEVRLMLENEAGCAVLRVQDTGIGIAPDQLERVFDLFAQVDASLERANTGLGLGLTLVKTLVELHGGTVEARSEGIGRGSEFIVRLPGVREALATSSRRPEAAAPIEPRRRILVVDDNRDAADSLATLLQLGGHEITVAYDGLQAVDAAAHLQPDLVLLDLGLPGLNGFEAARQIRGLCGANLMLVALTGWGQEEDRRRSRDAGFDAHLVKPIDVATVEALLGGQRRG